MKERGMEVLLLRHGKTRGNLEGRYVGRTDEPLLPSAKAELERSEYGTFSPERIYASPMRRCRETAAILFPGRGVTIWDGFCETDFGEFEYKTFEEIKDEPACQTWLRSGGLTAFPGGEAGAVFRKRCRDAFSSCVRDARKHRASRIAVVAHGGTVMSVMEAFGKPQSDFYHWQVKNGEGYRIIIDGDII